MHLFLFIIILRARHLQIVISVRCHVRSGSLWELLRHICNMTARAFFHDFLRGRHYDLELCTIIWAWQSHVILIVLVDLTLDSFCLHTEAGLLFIFQYGLDQFTHDSPFFCLYLVDLNFILLGLLSHFVELLSEVVASLIELRLLTKI